MYFSLIISCKILSLRIVFILVLLRLKKLSMRSCIELISNIVAVHLFVPGELTFDFPFNVEINSVKPSQVILNGSYVSLAALQIARGLVVDTYNNIPVVGSIDVEPGITVKESAKRTTAGDCYVTKVSVYTYSDVDDVREFVRDMSSCDYFDMIVVDISGHIFLCRGVDPAASISLSVNLPFSSRQGIEIEMASVNGIIPIEV